MPTRIWSRPASSRMKPESAPDKAGPRRASGGSGGGPRRRRDVAEADDAVVVGDPHQRHPPAVGRLGRARHAGPERALADADLVLAQERRTGRRESIGHGRKSTRPSAIRPADRSPSVSAVGIERLVDVVELGARPRSSPRRRHSALASVLGGSPREHAPSTVASAISASASACRLATSASSSSRSISRRTSASGGARAPASAALGVSSGYSPLIHDSRRLRGRATGVLARTIAAASIAVRPGQGGIGRGIDGERGAARRACLGLAGVAAPSTTGRRSPPTRPRTACRRPWPECYRAAMSPEYPIGPGCRRGYRRRSTPTRSWRAAWTRCRTRPG